MAEENKQKIKLLRLVEMLRHETDEEHAMTTQQIISALAKYQISCDRRSVSRDMQMLNEEGFEVLSRMNGHKREYYIEDRTFSIPELKILIDAVQAASFITEKKTAELIDKIAALGSSHRAEILRMKRKFFNTRKHTNESIYYNVDALEEAIQSEKQVSFLYFDLNEKGKKVYRKESKIYITEPLSLVYNEDNYYIVCYSSKYGNLSHYRVDRMDHVNVLDEPVTPEALANNTQLQDYTEQFFKMYGGTTHFLTLEFDDSLIGAVFDRFGEHIKMKRVNEKNCSVRVKVQISPPFWGWLLQFGGMMRVTAPQSAVKECNEFLEKTVSLLKRDDTP